MVSFKNAVLITPDPRNIEVLKDFPVPNSKKQLESFLGMGLYLSKFTNKFSMSCNNLRELCKYKGKWNENTWNEVHQREFDEVKNLMSHPANLSPYNPDLPLFLQIDSARYPAGTGFMLFKKNEVTGEKFILQMDSKKFTETFSNYSPYLL